MTQLGVQKWDCSKPRSKGCAFLTVENEAKGRAVIQNLNEKIWYRGQRHPMQFQESKSQKSSHAQRLENDLNDTVSKLASLAFQQANLTSNPIVQPRTFPFSSLAIGYFDYSHNHLHFHPTADISGQGDLVFGKNSAALLIYPPGSQGGWKYRIDITYWSVKLITISVGATPAILFSLEYAPKVFTCAPIVMARGRTRIQKSRVPTVEGINADEQFRYCFVYRAQLRTMADVARAKNLMRATADFPQNWQCEVISSPAPHLMADAIDRLQSMIVERKFDYIVAFQILKLATNGKLLPWTVEALLPQIAKCNKHYGIERTAIGLRELYKSAPSLGPETSFEEFTIEKLSDSLTMLIYSARIEHGPYDSARRNEKLQVVHRVRVTPMGLYLEGPEAEVSNRVLRTHKKNDVAFLRTQFSEEDGMRLEGTLVANLNEIYGRFRSLLQSGVMLFGHRYSFLGFSSSSLRGHTCWMMRPFSDGHAVFGPERVIKEIGDFTTIKSPAKCAARIGQAFTETTGFVSTSTIAALPDVERNGRIFSDGCGTISRALCEELSLQHIRLAIPAVVFQIRFRGEYRFSLHDCQL
jgi:hypothetical protein